MRHLRIGYFADGPWSHQAFNLIVADPDMEMAFVVPRKDTQDETLRNLASKHNIDYLENVGVNSEDFYKKAIDSKCDLFVSMSFDQVFKPRIANLPRLKTINCHASKLPFYRGRNVLNWVLINDEKEFGITVHFVDEGIDTGDIILQRLFPISDNDDYSTLLQVAHRECAVLLKDALGLFKRDEVKSVKQSTIHPVGFYCGRRGVGDEIINWNQTSRDIFNFVRAICSPGPMALTFRDKIPVKINKARMISGSPVYKSTVGQLVAKTGNGFLVKTADTVVEISEIETEGVLKVGDKLK